MGLYDVPDPEMKMADDVLEDCKMDRHTDQTSLAWMVNKRSSSSNRCVFEHSQIEPPVTSAELSQFAFHQSLFHTGQIKMR
jgi:hypothetical protein